jgi:hypothetical protein
MSILVSPNHGFRIVLWRIRSCVVLEEHCGILERGEDCLEHLLLVEGGIVLGLGWS